MRNQHISVRSRIVLVGVIACVGALLATTSVVFARAGGPSQQVARIARTTGYGATGPGASLVSPSRSAVSPANEKDPPTPATGTLPFTGLDLLVVALIGAGLLGLGLRLRRPPGRVAASG
jgi:hypothetical protein